MKVVHTYATGNTGGPISKVNFYNIEIEAIEREYWTRYNSEIPKWQQDMY